MNILLLRNFNLFPSLRTYIRIPRTLHIQRHERSCKPSIRGIYAVRAHRGLRGRPTSVFRRHTRVYHAYASSLAYSNLEISDLAQQRRASMMRAQPIQNPCSGDYYRSVAVDRHVDHTSRCFVPWTKKERFCREERFFRVTRRSSRARDSIYNGGESDQG